MCEPKIDFSLLSDGEIECIVDKGLRHRSGAGFDEARLEEQIDLLERRNDPPKETTTVPAATTRLVRVLIVDPDERLPLDSRVLYKGDEKMTDLTDQELFYEIDIKTVLDKHNEARVKVRDKSIKEREELLEPVRIKDLRMVVVNIASF